MNVVRGHQRAELTAELTARLVVGPADVASRDLRWAKLLSDSVAADDAAVVRATQRLAQALAAVDEHAAIATAARAEERELRASASQLRAESDRRSAAAGPGPGGRARAHRMGHGEPCCSPGARPAPLRTAGR